MSEVIKWNAVNYKLQYLNGRGAESETLYHSKYTWVLFTTDIGVRN